MSAQEFGEWKVMFSADQLHPAADQMRHAQLLAAAHNGPLQRHDKTTWRADQFLTPDPWAKAPAVQASAPLAAQIELINSRL